MIEYLTDKTKKIILEEYLANGLKSYGIIGIDIHTIFDYKKSTTLYFFYNGGITKMAVINNYSGAYTTERYSWGTNKSPELDKVDLLLSEFMVDIRNNKIKKVLIDTSTSFDYRN